MSDSPAARDPDSDHGSTAAAPRWVRVSGIVAIVLAVLFVVVHLAGGGFDHHTPSDAPGAHASHARGHQ
jgi:hypothetical protein